MAGSGQRGLSAAEKRELWQRWRAGQSLRAIGRALKKQFGSVHFVISATGSLLPRPRTRRPTALTLFEREARRYRGGHEVKAQRIAGLTAFVSGILLVLGIAAAAVAGPTALGSAHSTNPAVGPWMMDGGHMGAGMSGGMIGFGTSGPASTSIPGAAAVRVQAANFAFTPSEIRLPKGTDVNLTLVNPDANGVLHDVTVLALGIHLVANSGETRTVGLRGLTAGRYDTYCTVPGHAAAGMRATVIVE